MIQKISARNIKGQTFEMLLAAVNLITGPNRRGKTARLDSARLGLLGYHPRLGKTNAATARLASGPQMEVLLSFDHSNLCAKHQWSRNGKGWSYTGTTPFKTPEVLLDFKQFTGLSGPERLRYVIERTDIAALGFTLPALVAAIEAAKPGEGDYTPEQAKAMRQVATDVASAAAKLQAQGQAMPQILAGVLTELKARVSTAKRLVAESTAAITGGARAGAEAAPVAPPRPKPTIDAELAALRASLTQVQHELRSLQEAQASHQRHAARKQQLESWLAQMPCKSAEITKLQAELEALQALMGTHVSQSAKHAAIVADAREKLAAARGEAERLDSELQEAEQALAELSSLECCPYCQGKGKTWKKSLQASLTEKRDGLVQAVAAAVLARDVAENRVESAQEAYQSAIDDDQTQDNRRVHADELRNQLRALEHVHNSRQNAQTELATLANLEAAPDTAALPALQAKEAEVQGQIWKLENEQTRSVAALQDNLRREQAKNRQAAATAELEALKAAQAVVEEQQAKLVTQSMGHLLSVANRFTAGILSGPLEYVDGELGYRQGAQWVSLDTFSGTEEAVAYIGLSVALAQEAPLKLVLMDEMGVIDDEKAPQVLERMEQLTADGTIHQFIGADPHRDRYGATSANVIEVE